MTDLVYYDTIRYDTMHYIYVRPKAGRIASLIFHTEPNQTKKE